MNNNGQHTSADFNAIFNLQKQHVSQVRQFNVPERIRRLKAVRVWIRNHRQQIRDALYQDYRKPVAEADLWEMYVVIKEINYAIRNLRRWLKPVKVHRELLILHTRSYITYEPKGIVLIIAPWNFPFMLAMGPFISALAAGNCIILKPSELAPNTSAIVKKLVSEVLPLQEARVIEGDKSVATELLKYPFDHIYFTGGTEVGKKIMEVASNTLTSVTLELGGKCPAIVDETANMKDAVQKIAWGKFSNAGQTCVAPDYILVKRDIYQRFVARMVEEIEKNYICRDRKTDGEFDGVTGIIDQKHFQRLQDLLADAVNSNGKVITGGKFDIRTRCITPTVITDMNTNARVLREEIFGPILPILPFDSIKETIVMIHKNPKPLAIYIFSKKKKFQQELIKSSVSGGTCLNELVIQFVHSGLPFGGVGESGFGRAHGYAGFKAFSNERTLLIGNKFSPVKLIYPPMTPFKQRIIDLVYRFF